MIASAAVPAAVAVAYVRARYPLAFGHRIPREGLMLVDLSQAARRERFRNPELLKHRGQKLADAGDAWEDRLAGIGHRGTTAAEVEE